MAEYKLEVTTGDMQYAGTWDHIFITFFGNEGQSDRTELDNFGTYTIKTSSSLGKLLLVKVEKDPYLVLSEDEWYCSKIVVTTPEGNVILFPCYRWISRGELVELRGGRAMKVFEEDHPLLTDHRKKEYFTVFSVTLFVCFYRWKIMAEGLPHINSFNNVSELPDEIRFSKSKSSKTLNTKRIIGVELKLKGMIGSMEKWESIEDMKKIFWYKKTTMSEYVTEHWKEDDFYGYQFLNGINPNVIKKCSELPPNFPVTEEMVKPFLEEDSSLEEEMEDGKIFLYDQKKMDGIPARDYNGEPLHVSAGLCLFYLNPEDKLMPIAIQLHQQPSEDNPIFLPSDSETDWLLAKMFIKNADVVDHEVVHHLMKTHFLAEVYNMATLRCFPVIHPLYKLLIPHFRYTFNINMVGRESIFGTNGILKMVSSLGSEGLTELMRRALSETTYSSLCLPENITARGLKSIPNFYYRDDGLKLWNIINRFVKATVGYYYPSDKTVHKDTELQEWISEIFIHAFLGNKASGFPACFNTVKEVIRFITVVIFTVTAQHAAVNSGQFDYHWVPNGSLLLHKHPPTTKGQSSMETILETLPNVGETVSFAAMAWVLSEKYTDVPLGAYPEERFDEPAPKQMIKDFQEELSYLSEEITSRNSELKVPYTYLNPTEIENSITI
uniref:Hydroperoxide isomerase ALOXE3-like n=1 Tax=Seriola dumerili TaxID=41447 RepID=A0A3B4V3U7_SERDU